MTRLLLCLAAGLLWAGAAAAQVTFLGKFVWTDSDDHFGGFSGVEMLDGGDRILALTDQGNLVSGQVKREAGAITGVTGITIRHLNGTDGDELSPGRNDSEGLAVSGHGDIFVSFEGNTRVSAVAPANLFEQPLPRHRDFLEMTGNGTLETLAIDDRGQLYAIPERSGRANRPFPVYRLTDGQWELPFVIPRTGAFLIVGADFGPDGQLFVLERDFTGIGFRTRVRRIDLEAGRAETILTTRTGDYGNLEGISLWVNAAGETVMTLLSDDNFHLLLDTQIVEYRIDG